LQLYGLANGMPNRPVLYLWIKAGFIYLIVLTELVFEAKMAGGIDEGRSVKLFIDCKVNLRHGRNLRELQVLCR
jgi:hypothetical protein